MKYAFYYGFPVREEICHVQEKSSRKNSTHNPSISPSLPMAPESGEELAKDTFGPARIPSASVGAVGRARS